MQPHIVALEHARAHPASASGPDARGRPSLAFGDSGLGIPLECRVESCRELGVAAADTPPPRRSERGGRSAAPERRACRSAPADRRRADGRPRRANVCARWRRSAAGAPAARLAALGRRACAISSRGRSKSKSLVRNDTDVDHIRARPTRVHLRDEERSRLVRPFAASSGFHRSPSFAMRSRTLSSRKSSIRTPFSTSSHVSGVDTVAFGFGRTE